MIQFLIDTFLIRPKPVVHPFVKSSEIPRQEEEVEEDDPTIEETLWGGKVVKAKVKHDETGFEYDKDHGQRNKLKPIDLDKFDKDVLRAWNTNPKNAKIQIHSANYKLVKPYVLSKDYTYKEIALLMNKSISWVQRIGPRVKDAAKARQASEATTLP